MYSVEPREDSWFAWDRDKNFNDLQIWASWFSNFFDFDKKFFDHQKDFLVFCDWDMFHSLYNKVVLTWEVYTSFFWGS